VCLSRAPKDFAGLTAVEPGGHPADGHIAVNLSESSVMDQTVSIVYFSLFNFNYFYDYRQKSDVLASDSGRNAALFQFRNNLK
jgi:hypothetical protein